MTSRINNRTPEEKATSYDRAMVLIGHRNAPSMHHANLVNANNPPTIRPNKNPRGPMPSKNPTVGEEFAQRIAQSLEKEAP